MKILELKNFSCIEKATLEVNDLTVIIGPQASGKSVLCKLFYFFNSIPGNLPNWAQDASSVDGIRERIIELFSEWFPPSTWGGKPFNVKFTTGSFCIVMSRPRGKGTARLKLSDNYEQLINRLIQTLLAASKKASEKSKARFEQPWRLLDISRRVVESAMDPSDTGMQIFIPAGRSFFTSVGKIVTAFEAGGMLDPVVSRFGRLVTQLREHSIFEEDPLPLNLEILETLIGGRVIQEKGRELLATPDGRNIPFSALSSGQQELLPLFYALKYVQYFEESTLIYIEEPEAHLFPSAQTELVKMFVGIMSAPKRGRPASNKSIRRHHSNSLVMTTHSPYVLAKVNNLIKAGQLAGKLSPEKVSSLDKIVPSLYRLSPSKVSAYAITEGVLQRIQDEDGLIDADYIDGVSAATGDEFDRLISLEIFE